MDAEYSAIYKLANDKLAYRTNLNHYKLIPFRTKTQVFPRACRLTRTTQVITSVFGLRPQANNNDR